MILRNHSESHTVRSGGAERESGNRLWKDELFHFSSSRVRLLRVHEKSKDAHAESRAERYNQPHPLGATPVDSRTELARVLGSMVITIGVFSISRNP